MGTNSSQRFTAAILTTPQATSSAVPQTVNKAASTTAVSASPSTSTIGQMVTLTATVSPSTATGSLQFFNGSTALGTAGVTNGQAQIAISTLPVGTNSLTAAYSGDANYNASSSRALPQTVNKYATSTSLAAGSSSPSHLNQTVTFTAAVTPNIATGTVQFTDGGTAIGTATISNGVAGFSISTLTQGNHQIRAIYSGDGDFNLGQSSQQTYRVNP